MCVCVCIMTCSFAKNANESLCLPTENIIDTVASSAVHTDLANPVTVVENYSLHLSRII